MVCSKKIIWILFIIGAGIFLPITYSYGQGNKAILDEKVRDIQAPKQGEAFGLLQEKAVRLKFAADETYDDNIFLIKDDTKYDYITTLSPGASVYYGNIDRLFYASYAADILIHGIYNRYTRINQDVEGRVELFRNSLIKLKVSDSFRPTTNPATSETNNFIRRVYNDFKTNIRYDMSEKTAWDFDYEQIVQNYISEGYRDYSYLEHIVSPVLYWHLSPKTSITGEYDLGIVDYYEGKKFSSIYHQARAGITGTLSPKSTIYLKAGYQYRFYDETDIKNTQGAVFEGIYDYTLSDKTSVEFIVAQNINESVYEDVAYSKSTNLYASVTHDLTNSLSVDVSGFYIRSDYPHDTSTVEGATKKRSDNIYGFDTRLSYKLRNWFSSFVGYEFKLRDSDIREFGYQNSRISGGGKIEF